MTDEKGEKRQSLIDSAFNASPPLLPGSLEARQARAANRQQNHPLNQLRAEISRGGLPQSNRFQMNINPPPTLASESPEMLRRIMIRTVSVDLPGNTLETSADNNIYGPNRNVVQGITYADSFDATFLMDTNFEVHQYFQKWQELMYNPNTWNLRYYDTYASGNIDIFVLDKTNKPTAAFRVWETYPAVIGPVSFSMANSSPINSFTVGFNFRYWSDIGKYGTKQPTELGTREAVDFQNDVADPLTPIQRRERNDLRASLRNVTVDGGQDIDTV